MNLKKIAFLIIQKFKKVFELFFPGYYSPNCKAVKKIIERNNLSIDSVYDIGCFIGGWLKERKKTFPKNTNFYLFDAQNLLSCKKFSKNVTFFNAVLGERDGFEVEFYQWKNGGSGSSYFKELGNTLWDEIKPKKVKTESLYSFIKKNNLQLPNYLKIDTQGTELEILRGMGDFIRSKNLYFIELEISLYRINEEAPLINEIIEYMYKNKYVLISVEQLPIVEYFQEKKLVQLNGVFTQQSLVTTK